METADRKGLNAYALRHYLFTRVPKITVDEQWNELLLHNINRNALNAALLPRCNAFVGYRFSIRFVVFEEVAVDEMISSSFGNRRVR